MNKSKFNVKLLVYCLLLIWVPTAALILLGAFHLPLARDVDKMGPITNMIAFIPDIGVLWNQALVGTYAATGLILSIMALLWIMQQAKLHSAEVARQINKMWKVGIMLPCVLLVVLLPVAFALLMPLNALLILTYWPWLLFLVEAVAFLPLQKATHKEI